MKEIEERPLNEEKEKHITESFSLELVIQWLFFSSHLYN
jgi:hypothetical protein